MNSLPRHVLVFRLSAMGDVAMIVPVLRAFVKQYPEVKVTVVSRPFFEPFFISIPNLNFHAIDLKQQHSGFIGLWKLYQTLKSQKIDAMADFHNVIRSNIVRLFFAVNGVRTATINKGRAEKATLTRLNSKTIQPIKTMFERHVDTLNQLGFALTLDSIPPYQRKKIPGEILTWTGEKNKKWIGIAPFAQYASKVYPEDLMQKVIDGLALNTNYQIFLFGGGEIERKKLKIFQQHHANVSVVLGVFHFEHELNLIQHLDLMISMDSGNGHLAAMYDIPVLTLWGATHPYAGFVPFGQPLSNSLIPNLEVYPWLPTSVYGNKIVPGYENAMRSISPEKVIEKANELLNK